MKAIILSAFFLFGTSILIGGEVEKDPDPVETAVPINDIHRDVTARFKQALGFGFSRIIRPRREGESRHHQLTHFMRGDEDYDVRLIGLVNDEKGAVYPSAKEVQSKETKTTSAELRIVKTPPAQVTNLIGKNTTEAGDIAVLNPAPNTIRLSNRETKTTQPTPLDKRAIEVFRSNDNVEPLLLRQGDKWIGHGPIRASEARCAKCHEVAEGELLGIFRYEIPYVEPKKD